MVDEKISQYLLAPAAIALEHGRFALQQDRARTGASDATSASRPAIGLKADSHFVAAYFYKSKPRQPPKRTRPKFRR
jgi:hypothetical protein